MNEWINVNDALPEEGQQVYFYTEDNCHGLAYYYGCNDFFNLIGAEELVQDITYWIALPDAPNA